MTEKEARQKLCFHAGAFGASLPPARTGTAMCVASECMAWRWQIDGLVMSFESNGSPKFVPPHGEPHGYCGMAGKP